MGDHDDGLGADEMGATGCLRVDALGTLPAKEREVIHLKFREGMSYREISAVTGHSLSHVGVLIHTGMKRLRGRLAPAFGVRSASPGVVR